MVKQITMLKYWHVYIVVQETRAVKEFMFKLGRMRVTGRITVKGRHSVVDLG